MNSLVMAQTVVTEHRMMVEWEAIAQTHPREGIELADLEFTPRVHLKKHSDGGVGTEVSGGKEYPEELDEKPLGLRSFVAAAGRLKGPHVLLEPLVHARRGESKPLISQPYGYCPLVFG